MSGFLLDTHIVSEVRKGPRINPGVSSWYQSAEDADLFLSVLVLGEIRKGVEHARPNDPVKARALEHWLAGLEHESFRHRDPKDTTTLWLTNSMDADNPA